MLYIEQRAALEKLKKGEIDAVVGSFEKYEAAPSGTLPAPFRVASITRLWVGTYAYN
ncbi:MAG: hypothetical protein ABSF87_18915 [Xanthobacteraceae bacterium]